MPRPPKFESHKLEAYDIYRRLKAEVDSPSAVNVKEELEELHPGGTASYRTVANWVREWNNQDGWQSLLDSPFQWHLLDSYGLSWDAGHLLNEMSYSRERLIQESSLSKALNVPAGWMASGLGGLTVRLAIWCWRVHLAAPAIGSDIGDFRDLWDLAQKFAYRELVHDILGYPVEFHDLEAVLIYKPWLDFGKAEKRHEAYHRALGNGDVPRLQSNFEILMGQRTSRENPVDTRPGESFLRFVHREHPGLSMGSGIHASRAHPELLASQQETQAIIEYRRWILEEAPPEFPKESVLKFLEETLQESLKEEVTDGEAKNES
ncbi:MAG: hypothetical protein O2783_06770 [Chloroflexi bacterium]|nr:hypothetical protein [Chloroflexota bacterium]